MATNTALDEVMRELAALENPKMREANERRGDDHGVNLTHLRALAKRLKTQPELALALWGTGNTAARLLATLVCKPKALSAPELDAMIRDIRSPKLLDWFIVNVVKPGRHAEELRHSPCSSTTPHRRAARRRTRPFGLSKWFAGAALHPRRCTRHAKSRQRSSVPRSRTVVRRLHALLVSAEIGRSTAEPIGDSG